jgi:hypothetical protein
LLDKSKFNISAYRDLLALPSAFPVLHFLCVQAAVRPKRYGEYCRLDLGRKTMPMAIMLHLRAGVTSLCNLYAEAPADYIARVTDEQKVKKAKLERQDGLDKRWLELVQDPSKRKEIKRYP